MGMDPLGFQAFCSEVESATRTKSVAALRHDSRCNVRALILRIGFGGAVLYHNIKNSLGNDLSPYILRR